MNWGSEDFLIIGGILLAAGLVFGYVNSKVKKTSHKIAVAITILLAVLYVWAELAVGLFTNWGS